MAQRARRQLVTVVLLTVIGAGVVTAWWARNPPGPAPAANGGDGWAAALDAAPSEGFARPSGPWQVELPRDHGAHPGTRSETWALSVQLQGAGGERIGVQLALLRVALVPPDAPARESAWAAREAWRGHLTMVFDGADRAAGQERFSRAALALAGHDAAQRRVWLEDWSIRYGEGERAQRLRVTAGLADVRLELELTPVKPALASDADGAPFRGFSLTRLAARGELHRRGRRESVSGLAWLDHLWGDVPLPVGPVVWDRLQLHLDDGTDVSMIRTRRRGAAHASSAGGYRVDGTGARQRLDAANVAMQPTRVWESDGAGGAFPVGWQVTANGLELSVAPLVDDQVHDFVARGWSGTVTARGRSRGRPVSGVGHLDLFGYEGR